MENTRSYRELVVWQKAMDLAEQCYTTTARFPRSEIFGLTSQIRRSASSIPANIAEGQGRGPGREFSQFLRVARGSLSELETLLLLSQRVGLLSQDSLDQLLALTGRVSRLLRGLQKAISHG